MADVHDSSVSDAFRVLSEPDGKVPTSSLRRTVIAETVSLLDKLPPELLAHSFSHLRDNSSRRVVNADLVAASHVCKHWRAAALGAPSLWTSFSLHRASALKECIARSGRCLPLSLSLRRRPPSPAATQHIRAVVDRVRSVHATVPDKQSVHTLVSALTPAAPALEDLHVKLVSEPDKSSESEDAQRGPPLDGIAQVHIASLRSLVLHDVPILFRPSTALVRFELSMHAIDLPSLTVLLDVLQDCRQLEEVSLHGWSRNSAAHIAHRRKVSLPRLRTLHLSLNTEASASLLSSLVLPKQTRLSSTGKSTRAEGVAAGLPAYDPATCTLECLEGLRRLELGLAAGSATLRADHAPKDTTFQPPALHLEIELVYPPHAPSGSGASARPRSRPSSSPARRAPGAATVLR
ncbi:hypothetical protein C8Q80DRAFT_690570 [Daedaleopsis nitida]|nr:hypothetical protein C8Q80DRAFT_690570 [Daedaleopsis nitida]